MALIRAARDDAKLEMLLDTSALGNNHYVDSHRTSQSVVRCCVHKLKSLLVIIVLENVYLDCELI